MKGITVQEIAEDKEFDLELEVISGSSGVAKRIYNPRIQKLGLVIAGYMVYLHPHRVQILGYTEISYLRELSPEQGMRIVKELCNRGWFVLYIWITRKSGLDVAAAMQVVALTKLVQRDPATLSQYGVIRGSGEDALPRNRRDVGTVIPTPVYLKDILPPH